MEDVHVTSLVGHTCERKLWHKSNGSPGVQLDHAHTAAGTIVHGMIEHFFKVSYPKAVIDDQSLVRKEKQFETGVCLVPPGEYITLDVIAMNYRGGSTINNRVIYASQDPELFEYEKVVHPSKRDRITKEMYLGLRPEYTKMFEAFISFLRYYSSRLLYDKKRAPEHTMKGTLFGVPVVGTVDLMLESSDGPGETSSEGIWVQGNDKSQYRTIIDFKSGSRFVTKHLDQLVMYDMLSRQPGNLPPKFTDYKDMPSVLVLVYLGGSEYRRKSSMIKKWTKYAGDSGLSYHVEYAGYASLVIMPILRPLDPSKVTHLGDLATQVTAPVTGKGKCTVDFMCVYCDYRGICNGM